MAKLARLYDTWPSYRQAKYNPDGSMKEEYRQALLANNWTLEETFVLESQTIQEVKAFDATERIYLERHGVGYTEYCLQGVRGYNEPDSAERQRKALASGEELSSLPDYIEPDEYYDYYSGGDDDDDY